ncbi:MAG: arginine N-succinyltransferase [Phycisphaerales bacterium JB037]
MFLIRRAQRDDLPTLMKLAKMVHFINLVADRDIISHKIAHSRASFLKAAGLARREDAPRPVPRDAGPGSGEGLGDAVARSELFMFVLEDSETGNCIGTSQLVSRMGGPGRPNVAFKLERRELFSTSLQTGTSHVVARLHLDESAPTEIGGLILQPSFRGHKQRLGKLLSLVRFHYVGLYPHFFSDRILAEMMARISPDGVNTLWEFLGRRFIPLSYTEADRFCQYSREFMLSLLPKGDIYLSLLPPEARSVVGEVGPETVPARRMLEKLGFQYRNIIDPFDGGPHLDAKTADIEPVKQTRRLPLEALVKAGDCDRLGIVSYVDQDGEFRAIGARFAVLRSGGLGLVRKDAALIQAEPGAVLGCTPIDGGAELPASVAATGKRRAPTSKRTAGSKKAAANKNARRKSRRKAG